MGEHSEIAWTDGTFNPWWGCVRVSPGCVHCYAEAFAKRTGNAVWGTQAPRRFFGDKHWAEPLKWNRAAEKAGKRMRVFCASMADVFEDRDDLKPHRERLWALINDTPWLDWQLLTKRPENIMPMWNDALKRCWVGTTVESQEQVRRALYLLDLDVTVRFLSIEPMLGTVDLSEVEYVAPAPPYGPGVWANVLTGHIIGPDEVLDRKVDWVIVGGESGNGARYCDINWIRSIVQQCNEAGTAVFVKQLGRRPFESADGAEALLVRLPKDLKGGDMAEWPEDLRVREFPEVA